jgi:glycosyltransferase involved in cell wall biosynthesis
MVSMRGGERVLEEFCRMFPDADIYTHVVDRGAMSRTILAHDIRTTFIARLPYARRLYQKYLPLMPQALEALDLTGYDLVISSESGPAKGVIVGPDAIHLCYCHSPMRYLWDQYHQYRRNAGFLTRLLMPPIVHYLRIWDVTSAARVDRFVANSGYIAKRIRKYFRRESDVVHPPVATKAFVPAPVEEIGDYYLWAGQLVGYKRPDIAVEAFRRSGRRLIVIGEGEERARVEQGAGPTVSFLGNVPFATLKHHLARCRALVFPGPEDFGIVPVEAQASGRPVIALAEGGALETVVDGRTGVLYRDCSVDGLIAALDAFEASGLGDTCRDACVANAQAFGSDVFRQKIARVIAEERARHADAPRAGAAHAPG